MTKKREHKQPVPNLSATRNLANKCRDSCIQILQYGENKQIDTSRNVYPFRATPEYINSGEMRDFQINGLNWLISLYMEGKNGVLGDEMGLGKTLQSIAFIGYLKNHT